MVSCGGVKTKGARSDGMGQEVGRAGSVEVWSAWAKISHGAGPGMGRGLAQWVWLTKTQSGRGSALERTSKTITWRGLVSTVE